MKYDVYLSADVIQQMAFHNKSGNLKLVKKMSALLQELSEHPRMGTGQPERLRHTSGIEIWSRRLSDKHRLVYQILENQIRVDVLSALGHYDDK